MKKDKEKEMSDTFILDVKQKSAIANEIEEVKKKSKNKESNSSKKEPKKRRNPFATLLLMLICIALGAGATYYYFEIYKEDTKANIDKPKVTEKLVIDDAFVQELVERYDINDDGLRTYLGIYSEDKLKVKDMDKDYLNYLATKKSIKDLVINKTFTKKDFNKSSSILFNNETALSNENILYPFEEESLTIFEYDNEKEIYKQKDLSEETLNTSDNKLSLERKIIDKKVSNNVLTITVAIALNDGDNIYKSYDKENEKLEKLEDTTADTFDIDNDYKKLDNYEYTFNYSKETNSYYLVSINIVK